jgi:thiamine biosynthesis lipoprotein
MHYHDFKAMNSDILLAADGANPSLIEQGFKVAQAFIAQSEQRFTRFSETSELAELNRSAGRWFHASGEMFQVLQQAYELAQETNGLFNPAILPALKQAGYDRSMDEIKNSIPRTATTQVIELQDFRQIGLEQAEQAILLPAEMQIDLGGIAKGWIAEQAARQLAEYSRACAVSAGGDMFLVNLPKGEPDWEVGLEDPLHHELNLAVMHVKPGAIATSSVVKRQWQHNGRLQHHLIDPRSGEPAQTEWLSVTVWAESAAQAEVYAKVLLIGGPEMADELFNHQTNKAYLAVDKQGWVKGSHNYHEVFHV